MYFSKTVVVSSLVSLALAADHQPVTIEDFDPSYDVKCGSVTVKGRDIYNSIAWGMSLNQAGEGLVSSEGDGKVYPSYYNNYEDFHWISDKCSQAPREARQHMPVIEGTYYNGGNPKLYRSIYWYDYEIDSEGHPKGYYCGTVYHKFGNSYTGCDVRP